MFKKKNTKKKRLYTIVSESVSHIGFHTLEPCFQGGTLKFILCLRATAQVDVLICSCCYMFK